MTRPSLRSLLLAVPACLCLAGAHAADVTVTWLPSRPGDGVVGYVLYYGTTSRYEPGFAEYDHGMDVGNRSSHRLALSAPPEEYFFAVATYNQAGFESDYSNELVAGQAVPPPPNPDTPPAAGSGGGGGGCFVETVGW